MAIGLVLIGLLLFSVMARQAFESLAPYTWQRSRCFIEKSEVTLLNENEGSCKHLLEYGYVIGGTEKRGTTWRLDPGQPFEWCSAWASFASQFPPQTTVDCYIDPSDHNRSVLDRGNVFSVLILLFPIGIISLGVFLYRRSSVPSKRSPVTRVRLIACGVAVCVFIAGTVGAIYLGIVPLYQIYSARRWVSTECTVVSSSLKSSGASAASSSRRGYFIRIIYAYTLGQGTYISDRYSFDNFGSGDDDALGRIIDNYESKKAVQCWVDPQNPYEAVLQREMSWKSILGFLPLIATFAGLLLFRVGRRLT